jgi:hypothetical protein
MAEFLKRMVDVDCPALPKVDEDDMSNAGCAEV